MTRILLRPVWFGAVALICYHLPDTGLSTIAAQENVPYESSQAPSTRPPARAPSNEPRPMATELSKGGTAQAAEYPGHPALFYNYYAAAPGGIPAALYLAPHPVPPLVGHVYYTYQAFLPHEYLYRHHREYYTWYGHWHSYGVCQAPGSLNRTVVRYQRGTIRPLYLHKCHPPLVPAPGCAPHCFGCP